MDIIQEAKEYLTVSALNQAIDFEAFNLISRLVDRLEWKPIESAPKDGEVFCYDLQWSESGVALAEKFPHHWQVSDREDDTVHFKPTHWMPLPLPPVGDKQK